MLSSGVTDSLWLDTVDKSDLQTQPLKQDIRANACVIGAGISGMLVAYSLTRAGQNVVVIDDGIIGSGETGRTTAHLVNALDDRYYDIERLFGEHGSRMAAESHTAAIQRIESIVEIEQIDCGFERVDGYLFLGKAEQRDDLERELEATRTAGLTDVQLLERMPLSFWDFGPALKFPAQAQFHPLKFLHGLAKAIQRDGSSIYTGTHADLIIDGRNGNPCVVTTKAGYQILCDKIVVCTNTPVNDWLIMHTKQLLAFSRQQVMQPEILDLNDVIGDLGPVLQRLVGSDREYTFKPYASSPKIFADKHQIEQVLINLVANARDATVTDSAIVVEVGIVDVGNKQPNTYGKRDITPGRYVTITVSDNGTGMTPDTITRAFDPFYTTKPVGQGTGLGLSMVYGIIEQSEGHTRIDSRVGEGTSIILYLPQAEGEVAVEEEQQPLVRGQEQTILVVEDEDMVLVLAQRILEDSGYRVHAAPDGKQALEFLQKNNGQVDMVLTDIIMPHLNGTQLAERLAQDYPNLPVVFMSGYTGDDIKRRGLRMLDRPFVQKPFSPTVLLRAVEQALSPK